MERQPARFEFDPNDITSKVEEILRSHYKPASKEERRQIKKQSVKWTEFVTDPDPYKRPTEVVVTTAAVLADVYRNSLNHTPHPNMQYGTEEQFMLINALGNKSIPPLTAHQAAMICARGRFEEPVLLAWEMKFFSGINKLHQRALMTHSNSEAS